MASNMFANLVSSYGLKSSGMQAIDVISGIPVKLVNNNGNATVYLYVGDKQKASSLAATMAETAKSMGLVKPRASGDNIYFGFKKARMAVEEYSHIREIISSNAGSLNNDQCPYCFMNGCDVAGMYKGGVARKMHRQCYLNNRNNEMEKIENADGNYITGIIGALLAAIIIVAFAEVLVLGAERIFYILYIAFPLFIAGGFRFGKGPYGAGGTFCHVVISVLAMFAYFYIQGCYYAADWYNISMLDAVPYFGDIMSIILDPEFIKYSALEIVLFVIGLLVAIFSNPTSKKNGRKSVQQNDVFITPVSGTDFSGYDTYHTYEDKSWQNYNQDSAQNTYTDAYGTQQTANSATTTQNYQSAYDNIMNPGANTDAYGNQTGNTASNDYVDVYGNNQGGNNNGFGN